MGFSCGIIGLPNVGKSTLFNVLTRAAVAASNYPFCTIEPNVGVVPVPDLRLERLSRIVPTQKTVPTSMRFVDIAGLVKGASKGEGLGNQFLGHIAQVEAVAHVVRCFEDPNVAHVDGSVDPKRDAEIIAAELALRDLEAVSRRVEHLEKVARTGDQEAAGTLETLRAIRAPLQRGEPLRPVWEGLSETARARLRSLNLLSSKPMLYVANVDEAALSGGACPHLAALQALGEAQGVPVVPICAAIEAQIGALESEAERSEYLEAVGLTEPGLNRLIRCGYDLLGLITFFTVGPKENRAWTVARGATAPEAAAKIHTDMARGFIRAEVIGFDDFVACGGEAGAREKGKLRLEGKEYLVRDGDVIHFRFSV